MKLHPKLLLGLLIFYIVAMSYLLGCLHYTWNPKEIIWWQMVTIMLLWIKVAVVIPVSAFYLIDNWKTLLNDYHQRKRKKL